MPGPMNIDYSGDPQNITPGGFFRNNVAYPHGRDIKQPLDLGLAMQMLQAGSGGQLPAGLLDAADAVGVGGTTGGHGNNAFGEPGSKSYFAGLQLYGGQPPGPFTWDLPRGLPGIETWFRRQMNQDRRRRPTAIA